MTTSHIIQILTNFCREHIEAIMVFFFLYKFGVIRFIWDCIAFIFAYIFLGYAYTVVACRKINKLISKHKESKLQH